MALLKNKLFLSLLSGVLLWISWYPNGVSLIIFIAFIPLFLLSDQLLEKEKGFALWQGIYYSLPAFLIWNAGATWWIWNSTPPGSVAAILLNSFFMSCVFGLWHWVKKNRLPKIVIPLAFIAFWCSWEFLHLHWQLTWPWLNLGNVFAVHPKLVQWYEYTGTFGGTIWILGINYLVYYCTLMTRIKQNFHRLKKSYFLAFLRSYSLLITLILTVATPIIISLIIYHTYNIKQEKGIEAVIVQQNTDAWKEQFRKTNYEFAEIIIETAKPKLTPNTALMVCPESALPSTINEEQLYHLDIYPHYAINLFDTLFKTYPQLNLISGFSTIAFFDSKVSRAARKFPDGTYGEFYNSSGLYHNGMIQLYHKSRLVPCVERMPYPKIFGFLEKLMIDLGGSRGSLGTDTAQRAFSASTRQGIVKVGAVICYESIFGELFSNFVKNGAQVMCVLTNDDWWGDTPGYKQHFEMSALRAIESRRYVMRAANTGISGFFDPLGNAHQKTKYKTRVAIAQTVYPNDKITFYSKHGDYLARIMVAIAGIVLLVSLLQKIKDICTPKKQQHAAYHPPVFGE